MSGGMRFDNDDIRALPLHMQEQLSTALVAQMAQAAPVAGQQEKRPGVKVRVRRLRFPTSEAFLHYLAIRDLEKSGKAADIILHKKGDYIGKIIYTVTEEFYVNQAKAGRLP